MTNLKTCQRCGLIQPYDVIWGYMLCDAEGAMVFGCPSRELVKIRMPDLNYDESIVACERALFPLFEAVNEELFNES
jgi:hypothetical protein